MAARAPAGAPEPGADAPIDLRPEIALGLLSAGLTGALFLLVVMLTEGWLFTPIEAAAVVSMMPVATLAASAVARRLGDDRPVVAAGAICMAGGLAALGLLPDAGAAWTLAPQVLVGAGIALALPGLTSRALAGRDPHGRRAAGTIAARHLGIVIGIVALTPVLSAQLDIRARGGARARARRCCSTRRSTPRRRSRSARRSGRASSAAGGRLPDLSVPFGEVTPLDEEAGDYAALEDAMVEEVDKAATHAFSLSFLLAGAIAALALVPVYVGRRW